MWSSAEWVNKEDDYGFDINDSDDDNDGFDIMMK